MADRTKIKWADATWNPIRARNRATGKVGHYCEHVSPGCLHCYSETFNRRGRRGIGSGIAFQRQNRDQAELFLDEATLMQPLRWRRPRRIFPCSMTDLFAEFVPDEWIDRLFAIMALCPQHTFMVLTKRAQRMREYISELTRQEWWKARLSAKHTGGRSLFRNNRYPDWPLPNVWLGVSVEDQPRADERIPKLRESPAALRFISFEPLLSAVETDLTGIGWAIVGGESGPGARSCDPAWVRIIRDQCEAAAVPFFFKQWGQFYPCEVTRTGEGGEVYRRCADGVERWSVEEFTLGLAIGACPVDYENVGKRAAGHLLDGREHREFPA